MPLLGFGNNTNNNLNPSGPNQIDSPQVISDCQLLLWHSWQCSIAYKDGQIIGWGLIDLPPIDRPVSKIIGHDTPLGYISDGTVYAFDGSRSSRIWYDIAVDGQGRVYALDTRIVIFHSWSDFLQDNASRIQDLPPATERKIYAMESRCFVHLDGHLFEVGEGIRLIETVDGLGFTVSEGRRNRLGIVTDAGDAYILDTRDLEPDMMEIEGDVRLLGLGSELEVVVTDGKVLARVADEEWSHLAVDASRVTKVNCARWSAILTVTL